MEVETDKKPEVNEKPIRKEFDGEPGWVNNSSACRVELWLVDQEGCVVEVVTKLGDLYRTAGRSYVSARHAMAAAEQLLGIPVGKTLPEPDTKEETNVAVGDPTKEPQSRNPKAREFLIQSLSREYTHTEFNHRKWRIIVERPEFKGLFQEEDAKLVGLAKELGLYKKDSLVSGACDVLT